jgi:hypothetical protein
LASNSSSRLRKNPGFDFALKGRGFSRVVSVAKSMAALAADALPSYQDDFFRSLLGAEGKPAMTKWVYLEQEKGLFNWTTLDLFVTAANGHGIPIMWTHEGASPWAVGGKTDCTNSSNYSLPQYNCSIAADGKSIQCYGAVTDLAGLHDFVVALVARYDGNHGSWNDCGLRTLQ